MSIKLIAGASLVGLVALASCGSSPPTTYTTSQLEAICVDRYSARVDPIHCTADYGADRDGFSWQYADVGAGDIDLPYYGSRVPSGWSRQRPVNITNITIVQPTAQTTRPPGTKQTSVKVPRATKAAPKPPVVATTTATVQRGGLGVKPPPQKATTTKKRAN